MLHLHAIGMDIHHHGAFSIQRPHGSGDWLLVIFKTDALPGAAENSPPPQAALCCLSPDSSKCTGLLPGHTSIIFFTSSETRLTICPHCPAEGC